MTRVNGKWTPATLTSYGQETGLQQLLQDDPSLVPGCAGSAVVRELSIPGTGFADLVLVDEAGTITVVECKLQANPEIRRKVVGQVLEYASGLWRMDYDDFERAFASRSRTSLVQSVREAAGTEVDEDNLRSRVSEALQAGRLRLVVAVDQITPELRSTIEFLNAHMSAEVAVMGLELGYFRQGDVELLVPASYGAEFAETVPAGGGRVTRRWSAQDLREGVDALPDAASRDVLKALLDHVASHGAVVKGGTSPAPSAGLYYSVEGRRRSLWSVYLDKGAGPVVVVNLGSIANASQDRARRVLAHLRTSRVCNTRLSEDDDAALRQYPEILLLELAASDDKDVVLTALRAAVAPGTAGAAAEGPAAPAA